MWQIRQGEEILYYWGKRSISFSTGQYSNFVSKQHLGLLA
jgi:hypothetical protein